MDKKIIITGVTGQDGSLMADRLLEETNHQVFGGIRHVAKRDPSNIEKALKNDRFSLVLFDVTDPHCVNEAVKDIQPDYLINFAANSFVGNSWKVPSNHFHTNAVGVLNCLEAVRKFVPHCRFYNAGSSEQFGDVSYSPQDINHPFKPRSPYGASKCAAHHLVKVYRESYDLYAVQGILFNHEGVRRGEEFVTRKISKEVVRLAEELERVRKGELNHVTPLQLGNLDAKRDWSDAEDFMEGIWLMLNQPAWQGQKGETIGDKPRGALLIPKDYVLASGETHSIREFVEEAFKIVGVHGEWIRYGKESPLTERLMTFVYEKPETLVEINPEFFRPAEVELLHGDATPAREELGWRPKTTFQELVTKMVKNDKGHNLEL